LVCGAATRHLPITRFLVFILLWSLLVYYPTARSTWHPQGWGRNAFNVLDFAGGSPVHINAGMTAAAISIFRTIEDSGLHGWLMNIRKRGMGTMKAFRAFPRRVLLWLRPAHYHAGLPPVNFQDVSREGSIEMSERPGDTCTTGNEPTPPGNSEDPRMPERSGREHPPPEITSPSPTRDMKTEGGRGRQQGALPPGQNTVSTPVENGHAPERASHRLTIHDLFEYGNDPPFNITSTILGTSLMWFGWFGFNGGSALAMNERAISACLSTHMAACFGGVTLLFWQWLFNAGMRALGSKMSALSIVSFCDGAIAGMVAITPAAGYVSSPILTPPKRVI
jgi:hypothetical protein